LTCRLSTPPTSSAEHTPAWARLIISMSLSIVYNLILDRFIAGFTIGAIK
jgi:hypothetical protein